MVDPAFADLPDIFLLDRRIRREDHARRNVEIDIVGKEVFGGPREREDVPEAEAEPAHMAEDELRLRRREREVEEFLIVAGDDAGIIHDDDHPLVTRMFDERQHARSEEHTSELQSLMRISYAVFCLKKKTSQNFT